jgi:hypothetical protein
MTALSTAHGGDGPRAAHFVSVGPSGLTTPDTPPTSLVVSLRPSVRLSEGPALPRCHLTCLCAPRVGGQEGLQEENSSYDGLKNRVSETVQTQPERVFCSFSGAFLPCQTVISELCCHYSFQKESFLSIEIKSTQSHFQINGPWPRDFQTILVNHSGRLQVSPPPLLDSQAESWQT